MSITDAAGITHRAIVMEPSPEIGSSCDFAWPVKKRRPGGSVTYWSPKKTTDAPITCFWCAVYDYHA